MPSQTRISASAMAELRDAMKAYANAVQNTDLSLSPQATYLDHVNAFMRWLRYEFEPGSRKAPYARKKDKPNAIAS